MPVHSREKKENNHDEMEVDYGENEGSSSEEEESESSSVSEEGDSSEDLQPSGTVWKKYKEVQGGRRESIHL